MASSGSWDFGQTATQLIQAVYEDLGVVSPGVSPVASLSTLALDRLNKIVKQHQGVSDGMGLKVHTRQFVTLIFAKGQQSYLIGPNTGDARASTQVGRTTISADEAIGQTVISITSNTDTTSYPGTTITMTSGDSVGIELNDGTIQWSTISGTPASTMTIGNALTVASSAGRHIYWFTNRAQRFPAIEAAVIRDVNLRDTPLDIYRTVQEYQYGVSDKYADSTPTRLLVEPLLTQTRVTFDAQPNDVTKTVVLTVFYPAEDYDAAANDIAFPQEALRWLHWELAFALSPSVGRWTPTMDQNRKEATALYGALNPEMSVMYFETGGV